MQMKKLTMLALILSMGTWLPAQFLQDSLAQSRDTNYISSNRYKHIRLVDTPTGCLLEPRTFNGEVRVFPDGGVLGRLSAGIAERFMFGIAYGGTNIIGLGSTKPNKNPGVLLKYFLIEESLSMPAVAIGFDSQGYGAYLEESKRYYFKSRGFFVVVSKSYTLDILSSFGLHLGINRSMEDDDGDDDPTVFMGFDVDLGRDVAFITEYDFATNDDGDGTLNRSRGILNAGVRWTFMDRIFVEFDFKQLLEKDSNLVSRELKIAYLQPF